jgi:hypothetical protein
MVSARNATQEKLKAASAAAQAAKGAMTAHTATAQRILVLAEAVRAVESGEEKVAVSGTAGVGGATAGIAAAAAAAVSGAGSGAPAAASTSRASETGVGSLTAAAEGGGGGGMTHDFAIVGAGGEDGREGSHNPAGAAAVALAAEQSLEEAEVLSRFYARYNKGLMEMLAMEKRRDELAAEKARLQGALSQVLASLSVTPAVLDAPNPLLVVNGRFRPAGHVGGRVVGPGGAPSQAGMPSKVEAAIVYANYGRTAAVNAGAGGRALR